jgi:hypothetical protein
VDCARTKKQQNSPEVICEIENITPGSHSRSELVDFIATFENEDRGANFWERRLAFWWEQNPVRFSDAPQGWVLRCENEIVGFLGQIAFEYVYRDDTYPALAATTWRINKEHRNAALPMFMKNQRQAEKFIMVDSTPSADVRKILERFNYKSVKEMMTYVLPLKENGLTLNSIKLTGLRWLSNFHLPKKKLNIVGLNDEFRVVQSPSTRIEKKVTPEYLRWFCNSPGMKMRFYGCVDEDRRLSSYVILAEDNSTDQRALSLIDYFTTGTDFSELLALVRHARDSEMSRGGGHTLIMLNALGERFFPQRRPLVRMRKVPIAHYYHLPRGLESVEKKWVLAEGDFGCF